MAEEDIPYAPPDSFGASDEQQVAEEDKLSPRNALVRELRAYLKKAVAEHNSFDVLHLPQNATTEEKVGVFDEMFNHKGLVHHLRQIEEIIKNKTKEN